MEKKSLKNGSYSILITLIVIAAAVILNAIMKILPEDMTQLDFSTNKLYTLSETTADFLAELSDDDREFIMTCFAYETSYIKRLRERFDLTTEGVRSKKRRILAELQKRFFEEI